MFDVCVGWGVVNGGDGKTVRRQKAQIERGAGFQGAK